MTTQRKILGTYGEELVAHWLEQEGFTIKEKNYTSRTGEIDIIALKDTTLVFVEVKLRRNPLFALSDLITPAKQHKIIKTARWYIAHNNLYNVIYRFDVALLEYTGQDYALRYIPNAFTSLE